MFSLSNGCAQHLGFPANTLCPCLWLSSHHTLPLPVAVQPPHYMHGYPAITDTFFSCLPCLMSSKTACLEAFGCPASYRTLLEACGSPATYLYLVVLSLHHHQSSSQWAQRASCTSFLSPRQQSCQAKLPWQLPSCSLLR